MSPDSTLEENIRSILDSLVIDDTTYFELLSKFTSLYQKELVRELQNFSGYVHVQERINELTGEQP